MSQDVPEPAWLQEARELGGVDENNNLKLSGLMVLESIDAATRTATLRLVTPLAAGFYDEELRPKSGPVRFDRDETGAIILPTRLFLAKLEAIRDDPGRADAERALAATACRSWPVGEIRLPADLVRCQQADGLPRASR